VRVYCLKSLTESDLISVLSRALEDEVGGLGVTDISIDDDSLSMIAVAANGDARIALGILERAFISAAAVQKSMIDPVLLSEAIGQQLSRFDNKGDHFYDLISALHKSVRGSATDASLYWFARMLEGGCDPLYIARRLVRMASEDIGNADPRALRVTLDAWDVQSRLGSPEGELAMAQAIIYLSVAPKSNASYLAFNDAKMLARQHTAESVPIKLRNAPTELMKSLDHGADYRYPHDYPHGYVPGETYLPEAIASSHLYKPSGHGFEAKIRQRLDQLSQLDLAFNEDKN
jgi:putative ATPase